MSLRACLLAAAASCVVAAPASAATMSQAFAFASLFVDGVDGPEADLTIEGFTDSFDEVDTIGFGFGAALGMADVDGDFAEVEADVSADAPFDGAANSEAFGQVEWFFLNGSIDQTITVFLDFEAQVFAEATGSMLAGDFAEADASIVLDIDALSSPIELMAMSMLGDGASSDTMSDLVSFDIVPGAEVSVLLDADAFAYAETVQPIPLPGALPLLLGGVGLLAAMRRRG